MTMKRSQNVLFFDELGEPMGHRGLDFPRVLSELGRNIIHFKCTVDVRFFLAEHSAFGAHEFIFIEFEAIVLCPASNRHIVFLAASKVIQGKRKLIIVDDAQIGIDDKPASVDDSFVNDDAGFCVALTDDLAHAR